MAEFSLGLTKTAVEGTLSLVKSAVEEEEKLKEKVHNDLVFISGELEMMQSFLRVAKNNNNNNNKNDDQQVVRLTWVRQLRNLAFDVEDCVEYVVHLDLDKSSQWGWLRRLWQTVNCRSQPLPLDEAVAEIKQLKARVEDVSQRNARYNIILGSNNNMQPFTIMPPAEKPPDATYPSSAFHILRDAWEASGTWRSNMCKLQELIAREDDNDLHVISVWRSTGGGDLGTASILRKAYRQPKNCEKFKSRAWVKLMHPFNHDEFVKSLLVQFSVNSSYQANTSMTAEVMEDNQITKDKLVQQMREKRYLVVLEDVFTLEEWDVIRMYLPDSKNGSRIILTTPQLGIALLCTGEPYQVSELRKFSDDQFLCAIFRKMQSKMDEFNCQLRRRGVIAVWGDGCYDDAKLDLIDILYKGIINWSHKFDEMEPEEVVDVDEPNHAYTLYKCVTRWLERFSGKMRWLKQFGGVKFERHSWVDVPDPFNLKVFARRLFLNFHSDDIRASKITEGGKMEKEGLLIEWCRESLFEKEGCLVVINDLRSENHWDLITSTFLSSKPAKGCILVITDEENVAIHCVKDKKDQTFNVRDLETDTSIATLINMGSWHYEIEGKKGRLFYNRTNDADYWKDIFKNVGGNNPDEGKDQGDFGVFTVNHYLSGVHLPAILRHAYYGAFQQQIEQRSWVDVPEPFNLMDFSWRLLLDFYSDDPRAKETVAVGLMEGTVDPIQKCREFLRNKKCLVVINGLRSTEDWDAIKDTFLFKNIQSIIIIIVIDSSWDKSVTTYCSPNVLRLGFEDTADFIKVRLSSTHFISFIKIDHAYLFASSVFTRVLVLSLAWAGVNLPVATGKKRDPKKRRNRNGSHCPTGSGGSRNIC